MKIFEIVVALGGHSRGNKILQGFGGEAPVLCLLCLLNETKYQSHVRVRDRFRSGWCPGSRFVSVCVRVRVRFVSRFVFGSCPGSRLVRVRVVFG